MKKLILCVSFGFLVLFFLCGFTCEKDELVIGEYNVDYSGKEWIEMSLQERIDAVSLPADYIEDLSTEDLATWALEYPFLSDVYLFDSPDRAIAYFKRTSLLFDSMLNRNDVHEVLLDRLASRYESDDESSVKKKFLLYYFYDIKDELSSEEKERLYDILKEEESDNYLVYTLIDYTKDHENVNSKDNTRYEGFVSSNQVFQYFNGAYYIAGSYWKYGVSATCYNYSYNDYSSSEVQSVNSSIQLSHPNWVFYSDATKKYNCHSYVWINSSYSNTYWLPSPDNYIATSLFNHVGSLCGAYVGDRITISDSTGTTHSVLVIGSGSNSSSINTKSKLGSAGVYGAPLNEIMIIYGNTYDVYN